MHPIILSGGSGTRLWPLSRPLYPKQFLALHSDKTLFQDTVLRLSTLGLQKPTIVCNEEHRFIVAENMRTIEHTPQDIILEPVGRNTAPAIAAAAISALKHDDNAVLLVLPADHVIEDVKAFAAAVKLAGDLADKGHLVTFGIKPTEAHTGYGYIESGDQIMDGAYKLVAFKEKPDLKTAEDFLKSGKYLWNSGMFCFKATTYLEALEKHHPDIVTYVRSAIDNSQEDLDFIRLDAKEFEKCTDISIDYAVMENTNQGAMVALDAQWSDVGSWDAVWKISEKDADNNVCQGDVITQNTKNSFIHAQDKLVCTLGLENVIVIDTQDALLVADKNNVQDIKDIVSKLKKQERKEAKHHRTVYRPWGHYDSICFGERDQVKRISVKPGAKLSLQKHFHRSEHWVVVKGTAKVTKGEETLMISENESVYLPVGIVHALENPGKIMLEIIEVQTGSYLGEDDIVRLEDRYGRA
tara:strand:- start:40261 stop:41664 length:1404 start_codon:yes stop_codon:yes gene_type:complete